MKNISTLDDLKANSIIIDEPIRIYIIRKNQQAVLRPDFFGYLREKTFWHYNDTVAFVCDYKMHVIPFTRSIVTLLIHNGFTSTAMFVPFANGDYPVQQQAHWEELKQLAREELNAEFIRACEEYADRKGYGSIDEHLFSLCLEIPVEGIMVGSLTQVCSPASTNWYTVPKQTIGTYSTYDGVTHFVYRNGKSYVTPKSEVLEALIKAGYRKGFQSVPFTNGEIIQDFYYQNLWNELNK